MKFILPCAALAAVVAGSEDIGSPLFLLSSTADLDLASIPDHSPVNDVHRAFSGAVSSCPTKNYAVIHQPGVTASDFESSYLPIGAHAHTNLVVEKIQGDVDVVAVVNTILMDCLHAPDGVKRVESLDTNTLEVKDFAEDLIKKSIMHIALPSLSSQLGVTERAAVLAEHDAYLKDVVAKYFKNHDYTLIYITKAPTGTDKMIQEVVNDGTQFLDGAEVPFVFDNQE